MALALWVWGIASGARAQLQQHEVEVEMGGGVALVRETMVLGPARPSTSPSRVSLPVPPGATLVAFRVCVAAGCRRGLASPSLYQVWDAALHEPAAPDGRPLGHASIAGGRLTVQVTDGSARAIAEWAAPTETSGALEHLALPGQDRLAPAATLTLRSPSLRELTTHALGEAHEGAVVLSGVRASVLDAPPVRAAILMDLTPSSRRDAAGIARVARALVAALPAGGAARAIAFAARARTIGEGASLEAALDAPLPRDLGAVAHPADAWSLAREIMPELVVWIGDGDISRGDEATDTLDRIVASGARLVVL